METNLTLVSTIAAALSAVIAAIALLLTFLKYRERIKTEHAERMADLLTKTRKDPDVIGFFKTIDLSEDHWYNLDFYKNGLERIVDNALLQFEHIMYLKEQKLLNDEEFSHYLYEIDKIVKDKEVQSYFFNLYHYCQKSELSFKYDKLLKYGIEKRFVDKDIYNKESMDYGEIILNF